MTREEAIDILENEKMCVNNETCQREECATCSLVMDKDKILTALDMALSALRPVSREQVEKAWRGEWKHYLPPLGAGDVQCRCTRCGRTPDVKTPFCAWCGAPMTDEAVQMVMRRLEDLHEEN